LAAPRLPLAWLPLAWLAAPRLPLARLALHDDQDAAGRGYIQLGIGLETPGGL
jgi:hypothetical protein